MNKEATIDSRMHFFNVGLATDYSPNMAIWIGHLAFWAERNLANKRHIHDGHVWSYDSREALCDYFPYFSVDQIKRLIKASVDAGLVILGNYNKFAYDKTNWYALTDKALSYFPHLTIEKYREPLISLIGRNRPMEWAKSPNGSDEIAQPIPDTIPDRKTDREDLISSLPSDLINSAREDAWSEKEKVDSVPPKIEDDMVELPSPHFGGTNTDKESEIMAEYFEGPFDQHQTALKRTQKPVKGTIATTPIPSQGLTVSEQLNALQGVNPNFEAFWAIYPIKKNKAMAKNAWECQGCDAHVAEIINKLQQQVKRDKQYLEGYAPLPANYIYREGWLDEIQEVKREGQKEVGYFDYDSTDWMKNVNLNEISNKE